MKNLNILLVEDEEIIRDLTRIMLEKADHRVAVAGNGREALKLLAAQVYDVVLLDIQMPVMDGVTTCKIIRQCEQGINPGDYAELVQKLSAKNGRSALLLIAVSGSDMPDEQQRCREAGMDDCLVKPFSLDQFSALLTRINRDSGEQGGRSETKKQPGEDTPDLSPESLDKILTTLYRLPREKMGPLKKSLDKALRRDLYEVNQALQQGKMPDLSAAAHRLRGTLLTLRQDTWAEKLLHLETTAINTSDPEYLTRAVADLTRAFSPFLKEKQSSC